MGVCESQNEIPNKIQNEIPNKILNGTFRVRTKFNKIKVSSKYIQN